MKKLLTLILCWLLAFSAIAETTFKAKTAASVAGGYVTSLNKVDGSFEDVTSQWVTSVGTIVKTESTEMQGNNIGVWSGTGAGTLDLQWTATASNTYEASAQVDVQGEDDVYVCAYVGTTETGCKLIPALSKIQKVSVVADSVIASAFHLRLKHTGSDAFSVKVDDGKIEPWTPQAVNLNVRESITYTGYTSKDGSNRVKFRNILKDTGSLLVEDDNSGSFTKFTLKKPCQFKLVLSAGLTGNTSVGFSVIHYNSSGTVKKNSQSYFVSAASADALPMIGEGDIGDYFVATVSAGTITDDISTNFSITASAISENVVQSWQDGTEWTSYTPTFESFGTVSNIDFKWRRDKSDVLIRGKFTVGTPTAAASYFYLPSGLLANDSKDTGKFSRATIISSFGYEFDQRFRYTSGSAAVGFIVRNSGNTGTSIATGSNMFSAGDVVYVWDLRIPIQGWSSTPPLYALPSSKENRFEARIANNGTASISSKNADFLTSVTRTAPGFVTVDYTKLGLTAIPSITVSHLTPGSGVIRVNSASTTQAVVYTANTTAQDTDLPFSFKLAKQDSDYTAPGVFVGSLAKDYTAYVDASEAITNATDNFITSCTNADPTVCTFATNKFGTPPYCNAQKTSSADVYVTTTSTTSVTIERSDASSPFSLFCQIK